MSEDIEANVNIHSRPSDLKITDLRIANLQGAPFRSTIIRIDTDQGLSGYGEVRDGGSATYALILKSRLIGENPCNVDKIFRKIKQFGHHARQAGGVCGIEMALMDLAGKAYGVPAYQLAGGKFRDRILCYCDTPTRIDGRDVLHRFAGSIDKAESRLRGEHGFEMSQGGRSSGTVFSHDADDTGLIPGQARFDDVFKRQHIPGFRGNDSRSNRCSHRAHGFGPVENGKRCTQDTISGTAVHK